MDTQGSVTHIVEIFKFWDVSGPRATKWPKLNRLLKIVNYFTCMWHFFLDSRDPQKLIWIDTQGSLAHIAQLLKFTNQSGPRPYFATKNKWPQKHIFYQFPHYFLTHLKPHMVSKATKHMYKSWENLHIGPPSNFEILSSVTSGYLGHTLPIWPWDQCSCKGWPAWESAFMGMMPTNKGIGPASGHIEHWNVPRFREKAQ